MEYNITQTDNILFDQNYSKKKQNPHTPALANFSQTKSVIIIQNLLETPEDTNKSDSPWFMIQSNYIDSLNIKLKKDKITSKSNTGDSTANDKDSDNIHSIAPSQTPDQGSTTPPCI